MLQLEIDFYFDVIYINIYLQIGEVIDIKQPVIIQGDTIHVIQFFDDFIYIWVNNDCIKMPNLAYICQFSEKVWFMNYCRKRLCLGFLFYKISMS